MARPSDLARIQLESLAGLYSVCVARHRLCPRRVVPVGLRQVSLLLVWEKNRLEELRRRDQMNERKEALGIAVQPIFYRNESVQLVFMEQ